MLYGRVIGTAVSTVKHASMNGQKLLVIQPCMADGESPDGDPQVAIDGVGAGIGELVVITSDGASARESLQADRTPVRWTVVGIDDGLAR
ncbi:MAG: EutN/CcmL family microcompartment protein [Planctomycetaceae bacterium]|nr:EutN/CcmL family microcompartment protein [Planctomycetaceae bacterium]